MTFVSLGLSYRYGVLCLFEALYPAPWARPFSKDLLAGGAGGYLSHLISYHYEELCPFGALYPAPLARPFSKGLLARDCLTWSFIPLRRIVPLRDTLSCAFGATLLQGSTRGSYLTLAFIPLRGVVPLRGTISPAFGAALLQGPIRWGLSGIGFHTADGLLFAFSFRKVFVGAPEAFLKGDFRLPVKVAFGFGVVQGGAVDVALSGFIVGRDDLFA